MGMHSTMGAGGNIGQAGYGGDPGSMMSSALSRSGTVPNQNSLVPGAYGMTG